MRDYPSTASDACQAVQPRTNVAESIGRVHAVTGDILSRIQAASNKVTIAAAGNAPSKDGAGPQKPTCGLFDDANDAVSRCERISRELDALFCSLGI